MKANRQDRTNVFSVLHLPLCARPLLYSNEELSKQSHRQRPTCTPQCSQKIGMAIRCQNLQGFQQCRGGHESSPDHERPPGPSEPDN